MPQNITIAGASYSDVPIVQVPKTGGGTASFVDSSDANAAAADISQDKTAYVCGVKVVGTRVAAAVSGTNLTLDGTVSGANLEV